MDDSAVIEGSHLRGRGQRERVRPHLRAGRHRRGLCDGPELTLLTSDTLDGGRAPWVDLTLIAPP